jgi:hypothetical protein
MKVFTKWSLILAGPAVLGLMIFAQDAPKKGGNMKKGPGILQPQMEPIGDKEYKKPMGTFGSKPDTEWTQTTVGAGVDGKPLAGRITTVVGEIVDFSCYLQLGKHGDKHRACGQKCAQTGQPIGLLRADGTLFMLMEEEHDPRRDGMTSDFRKAAADHMAHIMEVTGTLSAHNGYRAIYVQGFVKK